MRSHSVCCPWYCHQHTADSKQEKKRKGHGSRIHGGDHYWCHTLSCSYGATLSTELVFNYDLLFHTTQPYSLTAHKIWHPFSGFCFIQLTVIIETAAKVCSPDCIYLDVSFIWGEFILLYLILFRFNVFNSSALRIVTNTYLLFSFNSNRIRYIVNNKNCYQQYNRLVSSKKMISSERRTCFADERSHKWYVSS